MGINDIVNSMWGNVKGLGGRVKNYLGGTVSPKKIEEVDVSKRRGNGAGLLYVLLAAVAITAFTNKLKAETFNVDPSMSVGQINQVIAAANGGEANPTDPNLRDTINFGQGTYTVLYAQYFNFLPCRNYTPDARGVIIRGQTIENAELIDIINGGDIDIVGNSNLILQNAKYGILIGEVPYNNINIRGVNSEGIYKFPILGQNIEHDSPLVKATVEVRDCFMNGGEIGVNYDKMGKTPTQYSPYFAVYDCTGVGLQRYLIRPPKAIKVSAGGVALDDPEIIVLGNDEISENSTFGSPISPTDEYYLYDCPTHILQADIPEEQALITGEVYYDPYGNPHVFDGENCFLADSNDLYKDTFHPTILGRGNLGKGRFIGVKREWSQFVAGPGTLSEFCNVWLIEEDPNNPNNGYNPKLDLNGDSKHNFKDLAIIASSEVWRPDGF